jgi:hypothetical protein
MAAREELPLPVRRWRELVAAARLRCAGCGSPWLDRRERWRLVLRDGETGGKPVLRCPACAG